MKLNILMIITAALMLFYGMGFVLAPAPLLSLMGLTADRPLMFVTQAFGAALVGYAVVNWFARNDADTESKRAIVLANAIFNAIAVALNLLGTLGGVLNALGWSNVAIHLLLALGFAYFRFIKRRASPPATVAQ